MVFRTLSIAGYSPYAVDIVMPGYGPDGKNDVPSPLRPCTADPVLLYFS